MEFVKRNMLLVIVLAITAILSSYFIYLDIKTHGEVAKASMTLEELREKIDGLNKQNPAPLQENLIMIKADVDLMEEKAQEVQRIFGKPYREALKEFAKTLELKEKDILDKFRAYYNSDTQLTDRTQILDGFLKDYSPEKVSEAKANFKKTIQPYTVETISDSVLRDILLHALGLPRTMSPTICKTYVTDMIESMSATRKTVPGAPTADAIKKFTFDFQTGVPPSDQILPIIRHMQLYEDIFARMRQAGIYKIEGMDKLGRAVYGDAVSEDYLKLSYKIRVDGEMQSIRDFINNLQEAYRDNRVYVIKEISLQELVDDTDKAREIVLASSKISPIAATTLSPEIPESPQIPMEQTTNYGKTLVGENKLVQADIEMDYYIFVGDELKQRR